MKPAFRHFAGALPHGQRQTYFQRDRNALRLSPRLASASAPTAQTLQPNRLHLPTAADIHPPLDPLRRWFDPHHTASGTDQATARRPTALNDERLTALVRYAELEPTEVPSTPPNPHQPGYPGQTHPPQPSGDRRADIGMPAPPHPASARTWEDLLYGVLLALDTGNLLAIDNLGAHLHPLLTAQVVRWFQDPAINRHRAQLIFNSHHTGLLGQHLGVQLARDQTWFTEKDQHGATRLFPLTEFQIHDLDDIEGHYLQGRYGAVPFLDPRNLAVLTDTNRAR